MKFWSRPLWSSLFPEVSGTARARRRRTGDLTALEQLESREMLTGFLVTSSADTTDAGTLRWAIEQANANVGADTIAFDASFETPQTIVLNGTQLPAISDTTGATAILGPGADLLTISGDDLSLVIEIAPDVVVAIDGLTIAHGNSQNYYGSGILNAGQLTLSNIKLSDNLNANSGGAIYSNGFLNISNSTIENSHALLGGGIYSTGILIASHVKFLQNSAEIIGGGLYTRGTTSLSYCEIVGNSVPLGAVGSGGGIYQDVGEVSVLTVSYSTLSDNSGYYAGALRVRGHSTVVNSTLSENHAFRAGAIANENSLQLLNSTLTDNTADYGAAIYDTGFMNVTNATIVGNTAMVAGGGILEPSNDWVTVINSSIVAGNFRGNIANNIEGQINYQQSYNNLIGPGTSFIDTTTHRNILLDADDNIRLAPLGNYGGPTATMPLLAGSPAIDAGDFFSAGAGLYNDQRGPSFVRIQGTATDIGAVESSFAHGFAAVEENQNFVRYASTTGLGYQPYSFSLTGGDDAASFAIDPQTGELTFLIAPDFESPTDSNFDNVYDVEVTVADADGLSLIQPWTVRVDDVAERPILTLTSDEATYQIGDVPLMDSAANINSEPAISDYSGAKLVVSISVNRDAKDLLKIVAQGLGNGQISVKKNNVLYGGVVVGTVVGGANAHPNLEVRFNGHASEAAVSALLKQISFSTKNKRSPQPSRILQMQVRDVSGWDSNTATRQIHVVARTAAPHASARRSTRVH